MFRKSRVSVAATFLLMTAIFVTTSATLDAFDFKRFFRKTAKVLGISGLVRAFARPLNSFINELLVNKKVENRDKTKVVPIISFGERKAIGAAQVSGSDEALEKVRAVILYEDVYKDKRFRVKALVPGDSSNPTRFSRVYGIGVTAVIDVKI